MRITIETKRQSGETPTTRLIPILVCFLPRTSNLTILTQNLEHCIEMIRINLLCNADAGIIPFKWVENYQRPLPDFSTTHKCRDWEGVLGWARKKEIFVPADYRWARGANEKVFPRPAWMLAESIHH